jgi:hypothetical protein
MSKMMNMKRLFLVVVGLTALVIPGALSMADKATGIAFPDTRGAPDSDDNLQLFGVGVRKKGPIKVYSVGMYCSAALKEKLGTMSRTAEKGKAALTALRQGARAAEATTFLLEMSFKVGAEKMAVAIADSVASRHQGEKDEIESLKALIVHGVSAKPGGAATKGTTFAFGCSPAGIQVAVDGKVQGDVPSATLSQAFCDVYLDDKCVSPPLRASCLEHCCAP